MPRSRRDEPEIRPLTLGSALRADLRLIAWVQGVPASDRARHHRPGRALRPRAVGAAMSATAALLGMRQPRHRFRRDWRWWPPEGGAPVTARPLAADRKKAARLRGDWGGLFRWLLQRSICTVLADRPASIDLGQNKRSLGQNCGWQAKGGTRSNPDFDQVEARQFVSVWHLAGRKKCVR